MTPLALDAYQTAAIWLILACLAGLFLGAMVCHTGRRMDAEISVMLGDHYDDDPLTEYERRQP